MKKSSRHSKISGDFGEYLVLYWLSKYGYECANIDHVGIDLIAVHPNKKERMGISVKTRSRLDGTGKNSVDLTSNDVKYTKEYAAQFGFKPYVAIVVDVNEKNRNVIYCFLMELKVFLSYAPGGNIDNKKSCWSMTEQSIEKYRSDKKIQLFEFDHSTIRFP